jgi:hypothetical protein
MSNGPSPARKRIVASATSSGCDAPNRLQPIPRPITLDSRAAQPPVPHSRRVRFDDEVNEERAVQARAESVSASVSQAAESNVAAELRRCVVCNNIPDATHCRWVSNGFICISCARSNSALATNKTNHLNNSQPAHDLVTGEDAGGQATCTAAAFLPLRDTIAPPPNFRMPSSSNTAFGQGQASRTSEAEFRDTVRRVKLTPKQRRSYCQLICNMCALCAAVWVVASIVTVFLLSIF